MSKQSELASFGEACMNTGFTCVASFGITAYIYQLSELTLRIDALIAIYLVSHVACTYIIRRAWNRWFNE